MEQRENSGAIFINDRKRPEKTDPNMTGKALVGGKEYYINGWTKYPKGTEGVAEKRFLSLSFKPVDATSVERVAPTTQDEDLPF